MARTLVADLAALAPDETARNRFCQQQGKRMARFLQRDGTLRRSLLQGDTSVGNVLMELNKRDVESKQMFDTIESHHRRLRTQVPVDKAPATTGWKSAIQDTDSLRQYAEAAAEMGTRRWVRQGISWCAALTVDFFHADGLLRLLRREARERSGSKWLTQEEQQSIDSVVVPQRCEKKLINLLDVGSCGSLFDGIDGIKVTALDLCPNSEFPLVYQSDFLALDVGPAGSAPLVQQLQKCQPRSLMRLAANSTDVVVMSLVLSYLPHPTQRSAMVAKARQLLRAPPSGSVSSQRGLLLIHETLALDAKTSQGASALPNLCTWVSAIESLGFVHLRHETLKRSHLLAFATRSLDTAGLLALHDTKALPQLRLKNE